MNNAQTNGGVTSNQNTIAYLSYSDGTIDKPRTYSELCQIAQISLAKLLHLIHNWKNEGGDDMICLDNNILLIMK